MKLYAALGDLVLDIYHLPCGSMVGYYAGGSVWNDLMNLSSIGKDNMCYCVATCGNDSAADFVIDKLNEYGIDTTHVKRVNRQTKRFHIIVESENTRSQLQCPNCKETIWYYDSYLPETIGTNLCSDRGIVLIDSLKKNVLNVAKDMQNNGWLIAADIGHINHLRYMSQEKLKSLLISSFGFLQISQRVYNFLINKLSCSDAFALYKLLKCKYLNITNGIYGSDFLLTNEDYEIVCKHTDAVKVKTVDPTGAGDAYFSTLLSHLDCDGNFDVDIVSILNDAAKFSADRVSVIGAMGKYEELILPEEKCKVCGYIEKKPISPKSPPQRIATNVNHLLDRTLRALESDADKHLRDIVNEIHGRILTVGTGGSFAAAEFASKCINRFHPDSTAVSCRPRDILVQGLHKTDAVFLYSYSGKTKDIRNVYDFCCDRNISVYIITKLSVRECEKYYRKDSIISYCSSHTATKERGFISIAGTLIPMSIMGQIYYSDKQGDFIAFLDKCFQKWGREFSDDKYLFKLPGNRMNIDIFSGLDTNCAAIDLESKFIESGVARVSVHEKKDFSHGRFNIVEKYCPDLVIFLDNMKGKYSNKLLDFLERRKNINICKLASERGDIWGDLELVIAAEYFAKYISKTLGYDMSKPNYPQDAMTLYRYAGKDLI